MLPGAAAGGVHQLISPGQPHAEAHSAKCRGELSFYAHPGQAGPRPPPALAQPLPQGALAQSNGLEVVVGGLPAPVYSGPGGVAFRHIKADEKLMEGPAEWGGGVIPQSATTWTWNQAVVKVGAWVVAIWGLRLGICLSYLWLSAQGRARSDSQEVPGNPEGGTSK